MCVSLKKLIHNAKTILAAVDVDGRCTEKNDVFCTTWVVQRSHGCVISRPEADQDKSQGAVHERRV